MTYKRIGSLDFSKKGKKRGLMFFACYCDKCHEKVVMTREEIRLLAQKTGCGQVKKSALRKGLKRGLTRIVDKL